MINLVINNATLIIIDILDGAVYGYCLGRKWMKVAWTSVILYFAWSWFAVPYSQGQNLYTMWYGFTVSMIPWLVLFTFLWCIEIWIFYKIGEWNKTGHRFWLGIWRMVH